MKIINPKEKEFFEIISIIQTAKEKALISINKELIELYWQVGKYISHKVKDSKWGKGIVQELAYYISEKEPELKGFSRANLFRMKQFYEIYKNNQKVSTLLRQLCWSNHLLILSKTKTTQEREFYIKLCIKEKYSARELERQINSSFYERSIVSNSKVSPVVSQIDPKIKSHFKDIYIRFFRSAKELF